MNLSAIPAWLSQHWYWLPVFLVMAAIAFLLLRVQVMLRERSAATIEQLLQVNPSLCAERLENNRMLKMVFRRPVLELWKLDAYMQLGDDEKIERTIGCLGKIHLEPRDKLEYYQKSLSYYATVGRSEEALKMRSMLKKFIVDMKALDTEPYSTISEEADIIVGVYVEHNTALIKKLIGRAEHTKNDVMRGITQYRVAKLAYYKGDTELMNTYLSRAEKNLKDTYYADIISQARTDPAVLAEK